MDSVSILEILANSYLYGWAGAAIFLILFVLLLRQNTIKGTTISRLKKENKDMEKQLSENSEKIADLEAKVESLTEETEEKAAEISRLEDRLTSVEKELRDKTEKVNELDGQLKNYRKENGELKARVSELEKKTADQEALIQKKDDEIDSLNEKVANLEGEVERLGFDLNLATLYIHLKRLHEEFTQEYTQNILKGINTMQISNIDMNTAQAIFENAMHSFFSSYGQPAQQQETPVSEEEDPDAS